MKERIKLKRNLCVFKSNDHETSEMWQEQAKQSKTEITVREKQRNRLRETRGETETEGAEKKQKGTRCKPEE